jgi:O-antigen/teichoic acid export membrane protein
MFYVGSFVMISLAWSSILGNQVLISIRREKQFTISVTVGAIVNIIFNLILIPNFKGLGARVSSVIAEYTGMFLMAYFLRDILNIKKLFQPVKKYFIASLIMFSVIWIMCSNMDSTIMNSVILVGLGGIMYLAIMVITKDQNLLYGYSFIKVLIKG